MCKSSINACIECGGSVTKEEREKAKQGNVNINWITKKEGSWARTSDQPMWNIEPGYEEISMRWMIGVIVTQSDIVSI